MAGMVDDLEPDTARMAAAAGAGFSTATDLADWLVREADLPFREAHHATGRAVRPGGGSGRGIWPSCRWPSCRRSHPAITDSVYAVLTPERSARQPHELRRNRARPGA